MLFFGVSLKSASSVCVLASWNWLLRNGPERESVFQSLHDIRLVKNTLPPGTSVVPTYSIWKMEMNLKEPLFLALEHYDS
jgi:hypothetical protein